MTLLLLFGAPATPPIPSPVIFTVQTVFAEIVAPDRLERYPLTHMESLVVNEDKHGIGDAQLVSLYNAPWLEKMQNHATYSRPYMWSLDFYWRNSSVPLWSGPVSGRMRKSHQGTRGSARVSVSFESFLSHFLRRRVITLGGGERYPFAAGPIANYPDRAALAFIHQSYGGSGVYSMVTYNGFERDEFGPEWTVVVPTLPAGSGSVIWLDFQGNLNLRTAVLYVLEEGDITLTLTESPAATWTWGVSSPYLDDDLSDRLEISLERGTMAAFAFEEDYTPVNAWHMLGSGTGGAQVALWKTDPSSEGGGGSADDIGLFEDAMVLPGMVDATVLGAKGGHILGMTAVAENDQAYELSISEQGSHLFGVDFGPRNKVHVSDSIFGIQSDRTCIGYTIRMDHRGQIRLMAKFDNPVKTMTAALRRFQVASFAAGSTAGGEYSQKSG